MALEAVVFSQDHPLTSYNSCRDQFNFYNFSGVGFGGSNSFNYDLIPNYCNPFESNYIQNESNNHSWENQQYVNNSGYSSPDPEQCNCPVEQYLSAEAEADDPAPRAATEGGGGRRKRRRRSCKNKEEVEQQRMTHIAVERNRRKQMNEYLAVIRSLMPPSYVQRGDQASIVAGAINYVKELEQLLHSLEAHKKIKHHHHHHRHRDSHHEQPEKQQPQPPEGGGNIVSIDDLRGLLSFPSNTRHSNESTQQGSGCNSVSSMNSGGECGDEVQVTMVESHANVKIMAKKKPKQLLRLVAGFQGLRLSVLHLTVTTIHPSCLLYSFSLKVEEGCQVNSVDDITAAANHILAHIEDEASGSL